MYADLAFWTDCARCDRQRTTLHVRVRHHARVPELQEDAPLTAMHRRSDTRPCRHLFVGPDARRARIAARLRRNVGRLGDDQAGTGALRIVIGCIVGLHAGIVRAAPRHRRHDDAVFQLQAAEGDRLQYRTCRERIHDFDPLLTSTMNGLTKAAVNQSTVLAQTAWALVNSRRPKCDSSRP